MFAWLDEVRKTPGMYVTNGSLRDLETLIYGYYAALHTHGHIENVPQMTDHFSTWLSAETGWSMSCGWAHAIISYSGRPPLDAFFELVDRYRNLRPLTLRTAKLGKRNVPTGKCIVVGMNERIERPLSIEIVRYAPTRLHFLRFTYRGRKINESILMTGKGSHATSLRGAKRWAADEFQTRNEDWQ